MKKIKQPGDNFSLKTKKTEDPLVMQWINTQTNLMDSLRYLIENEIVRSGVRNLQAHIPSERNLLNPASSLSSNFEPSIAAYTQQAAGIEIDPEPQLDSEDEFDEEDIESWI
jgi:hypothetical protein